MSEFSIDKLATEVARQNKAHSWEEFGDTLRNVRRGGASGGFNGFIYYVENTEFAQQNWDLLKSGLRQELEYGEARTLSEYLASFKSIQDGGLSVLDVESALIEPTQHESEWEIVASGAAWWALERVAHAAEDNEIDVSKVCEDMGWREPSAERQASAGTEYGSIWHIADSAAEAEKWRKKYLANGATSVRIEAHPDRSGRHDVVIRLARERANEILGYEVGEEEWLTEEQGQEDEDEHAKGVSR